MDERCNGRICTKPTRYYLVAIVGPGYRPHENAVTRGHMRDGLDANGDQERDLVDCFAPAQQLNHHRGSDAQLGALLVIYPDTRSQGKLDVLHPGGRQMNRAVLVGAQEVSNPLFDGISGGCSVALTDPPNEHESQYEAGARRNEDKWHSAAERKLSEMQETDLDRIVLTQ